MVDWYETTVGSRLEQGDLLPKITAIQPKPNGPEDEEKDLRRGVAVDASVIVLTQTCDLEQGKVSEVLLAQVLPWIVLLKEEVKEGNESIKSRKFREKLVEGNVPNLSLLHETKGPPELEWSVVNFRRLFSLPLDYVMNVADRSGDRLRLVSPYKEHLAQAFARYIMRVGLPHPAESFKGANFEV